MTATALKLKVSAAEFGALAPDLKSAYVERGGEYVLQLEMPDGWAAEDVRGLKSALSAEREKSAGYERKLARFGDLDPDSARGALDRVEKMKTWKPPEE